MLTLLWASQPDCAAEIAASSSNRRQRRAVVRHCIIGVPDGCGEEIVRLIGGSEIVNGNDLAIAPDDRTRVADIPQSGVVAQNNLRSPGSTFISADPRLDCVGSCAISVCHADSPIRQPDGARWIPFFPLLGFIGVRDSAEEGPGCSVVCRAVGVDPVFLHEFTAVMSISPPPHSGDQLGFRHSDR